ncbi:MAG: manganese efflux pump MntP family protein [Oscillospiraceae bacterium]|jgi:putative Mn2+ efflux pump MntP|nr:manganese efflux pump MntP family protein [Oscillospiraceae bacterium]
MPIWEIVVLAAAVSMDAFAVAVCKGVEMPGYRLGQSVTVGLWFGGFQALMPVLGFFLGALFGSLVDSFDHWIVMLILVAIGYKALQESYRGDGDNDGAGKDSASGESGLRAAVMFPLAVATAIDASAVGMTLAFRRVGIALPAALIGCITFVITGAGVWIGRRFGERFGKNAERVGGVALILLGIKALADHFMG